MVLHVCVHVCGFALSHARARSPRLLATLPGPLRQPSVPPPHTHPAHVGVLSPTLPHVQERHNAFELLVDNLKRLNEAHDEDRTGLYQTLGIFENLIEAKVCVYVCVVFNAV